MRLMPYAQPEQTVYYEWATPQTEGTVGDVADVAASSVPIAGTVYDGVRGMISTARAGYSAGKGLRKWVSGDKAGAKQDFVNAAKHGGNALGRGVGVAASLVAPGAGGAAGRLATHAAAPLIAKAGTKLLRSPAARTATKVATNVIGREATDAAKRHLVKRLPELANKYIAKGADALHRKVTSAGQPPAQPQVSSLWREGPALVEGATANLTERQMQEFKRLAGL